MKRAKIMLTVLGILVIIGSALAFKAHKAYTGVFRCVTTNLTQTTTDALEGCASADKYTTAGAAGKVAYCTAFNAPFDADCPATQRVSINNQ